MSYAVDTHRFMETLEGFRPTEDRQRRALAMFSAAIAVSDASGLRKSIEIAQVHEVSIEALREVLLQSYLFLGFPRMLIAAGILDEVLPGSDRESQLRPVGADEAARWFERGVDLCHRVYRDNYQPLKDRVESISPEIFRWMIIEGYGKVLSRPGLDSISRELCIVSCLVIENTEQQLFSHMKGALNVGASLEMLAAVISDLGDGAGDGYRTALAILDKLDAD